MHLKKVTFSENSQLTTIVSCAFFECANLEPIDLPKSLISIGHNAFRSCTNMRLEFFPQLKIIDRHTFYSSGMTKAIIPSTLKLIGLSVFNSCLLLTEVIIPNSVIQIGSHSFCNCTQLKKIEIPSSVKEIEKNAFNSCKSLTTVIFTGDSQLDSIKTGAFCKCEEVIEIQMPFIFKNLENDVFNTCPKLKIVLHNNNENHVFYDASFSFFMMHHFQNHLR